jgi:hypothetical protein
MDGGAITLDATGKPLTVWRREKTVFASELSGAEQPLADSSAQPLVVAGASNVYEVWESSGGLMLRTGKSDARRLAEDARFAAAAALPKRGAIVVWESQAQGIPTLLAESVD